MRLDPDLQPRETLNQLVTVDHLDKSLEDKSMEDSLHQELHTINTNQELEILH